MFESDRDGDRELYVMNIDGSDIVNLTDHPADDRSSVWSPDGQRVAFVSERSGIHGVYVMDADGSDLTRMAECPTHIGSVSWAPDSHHAAFSCGKETHNKHIYISAIGWTTPARLMEIVDQEIHPSWSPDGQQIVLSARVGKSREDIFVVKGDGSSLTKLTTNSAVDLIPFHSD